MKDIIESFLDLQTDMKVFLFLILAIVLAILGSMLISLVGIHINTGEGTQVGYISAVEKSGVFFKTYTVYVKPTLESTQEDNYCVVDESIIPSLEEASVKKQNVKVSYFQWFSAGIRNCGGEGAIIKSVSTI